MFAVLLAFEVKPGAEDEFIAYWEKTTAIIAQKFGSLGSRLHKADSGEFVAYAQWPNLSVYETEQNWSADELAVREKMRATLIGGKPSVIHRLSLVSDLAQPLTPKHARTSP